MLPTNQSANNHDAPGAALADFRAFLDAERPGFRDALIRDMIKHVPGYGAMAPAEYLQNVEESIDAYLAALEDPARLASWAEQRMHPLIERGIELDPLLEIAAIYRQHFIDIALRAVAGGVSGAIEGLRALLGLADINMRVITTFYQKRMRLFELLVENALDSIVVTDLRGHPIYSNQASVRIRGYENASQMLGKEAASFLVPEDIPRMQNEMVPQLLRDGSWQGQFWGLRVDGQRYRMHNSIIMISDAQGERSSIATFSRDITAEYMAEQELKRQTDELRTAVDRMEQSFLSTPLATIEWDVTGTITRWNPSAERIFGWSAEEAIGKDRFKLLAASLDEAEIPDVLARYFQGEFANGRFRTRTKDGREIMCQWYNAVLYEQAGKPVGVLAQAEDLSAQLRAEEERSALHEQVIQAQQAALRELSTPLIPLADGVVAMPLIGGVDSARAQQVIEDLLQGVASNHATTAIIDITGVPIVDTQVAGALLRAAQAVELLGARVVITGIRPEVAQTLVGIGVNLGNIVTRSTLQDGIAYALRKR